MYEISYGSKYKEGLSTVGIVKRVRQEIKEAIKSGDLPEGLKLSIRTYHNSITPRITAVPEGFNLHNPEWVKASDAGENTYRSNTPAHTPEALAVAKKIERMFGAYNYDGSDIMTDYFNVNFYGGHVSWGGRVERADLARVRAKLNGEPPPDETPLEFGPEAVVVHLTGATHWINWSTNEVANALHVGADRARKVLNAMANEDKLFKTWNHRTQAITYRLPKKEDTPERNLEHREDADRKAAEVKAGKVARKAERKQAQAEYEERKAREEEEAKRQAAEKEADRKAGEAEEKIAAAEDDALAGRVRAKAAQLALEVDDKAKAKKVDLSGPAFMTKTIGWC